MQLCQITPGFPLQWGLPKIIGEKPLKASWGNAVITPSNVKYCDP